MIEILWASLAVPVIIHLVYHRKAKPLPFSSLYFLRQIDMRVHSYYRIKELLLLLLRMILLAALVGALRRTMLSTRIFGSSGLPTTVGIVLDNTYSMQAVNQGTTAFARARKAAVDIVNNLSGQDSVVLALMDSRDEGAQSPTTALAKLRDNINALECGYGTAEVSAPLQRIVDSLPKEKSQRREVYIITDMQKLCWTRGITELARRIQNDEILKSMPVFVVDAGVPITKNLTIKKADFGSRVSVAGTVSSLYCEVENTGARMMAKKLSLWVGKEKMQDMDVGVPTGGRQNPIFQHLFEQKGEYTGHVEMEADDLPPDNCCYWTVEVHDKVPVLIVNGKPSVVPYRDGAFYLKLALEGRVGGGEALSPIEPRIVADQDAVNEKLEDE